MTADSNLSYRNYGDNQSGCSNNYSNFATSENSADPHSKINICGDAKLVNKQPFSSGNQSAGDYSLKEFREMFGL